MKRILVLVSLFFALISLTCAQRVRVGAEVLLEKHLQLLSEQRVGIICNQTSVLPNGVHLVDTLLKEGIRITALFSPEHGVRGTEEAGTLVRDSLDVKTGLPIYALYGKIRKPTPVMLQNIDVLVFDLQDVGARFYTYANTMAYAMQAAAENKKKFIVLDRPNPINGIDIEGPVLDTTLRSFVGMFPIPIRHGLTLGELAKMIVGEHWIENVSNLDLTVTPMEGWKREMWYNETSLPWIPPSPNMKTISTSTVYPGTCLFEATNVSEGRGTDHPFEYVGAPWIDGDSLASRLKNLQIEGVQFDPIQFTPSSGSITTLTPKYKGIQCGGVYINVRDQKIFLPYRTALSVLESVKELYPHDLKFNGASFDRLAGNPGLRESFEGNEPIPYLAIEKDSSIQRYKKNRGPYLLY